MVNYTGLIYVSLDSIYRITLMRAYTVIDTITQVIKFDLKSN